MECGQAVSIGFLALFIWGRWRYDVVAFLALIVAVSVPVLLWARPL